MLGEKFVARAPAHTVALVLRDWETPGRKRASRFRAVIEAAGIGVSEDPLLMDIGGCQALRAELFGFRLAGLSPPLGAQNSRTIPPRIA